jgi:hypothetical protein
MLAECLKSQVAEHLYSKCEALSSNPNPAKKKKKKKRISPVGTARSPSLNYLSSFSCP